MESPCDPPMQDESPSPHHFWPMIRSLLMLKADQEPLPVFDQKGRPIGLGLLWGVDEQNQVQGKPMEGHLESPAFIDEADWEDDSYRDEWGEEVSMVDPVRNGPGTREQLDTLGTGNTLMIESSPTPQIVWWEEVHETAKLIFGHKPSRAGLQLAWHILIQHGYARYTTEWERIGVLLRFVGLSFIWQTNQLPKDQTAGFPLDEYSFAWITNLLGLTPYRLGWVAGLMNIPLPIATPDSTEFELTTQVLPRLADRVRPEIVELLQQHFGGAEGLSDFFSQHFLSSGWDPNDESGTGENLAEEAQIPKADIRRWVEKGCPFPPNLFL